LAKNPSKKSQARLGVWLFGAYGGLATTIVVGARAIARGLSVPQGLMTETETAAGIPLQSIDGMVFGGHEVRPGDYATSAAEIQEKNGTLPLPLLHALRQDLRAASRNVVDGVMPNAGRTIMALTTGRTSRKPVRLRAQVEKVQADLRDFARRNQLDRIVCVNLTSTEPALRTGKAHAR